MQVHFALTIRQVFKGARRRKRDAPNKPFKVCSAYWVTIYNNNPCQNALQSFRNYTAQSYTLTYNSQLYELNNIQPFPPFEYKKILQALTKHSPYHYTTFLRQFFLVQTGMVLSTFEENQTELCSGKT